MKPKVFFVIVGVFVVLLVLGMGLGTLQQRDAEEAVEIPSWSVSIRKRLEQQLRVEDVKAAFPSNCRDQLLEGAFVFQQGDSCTLIITESSTNVRTLTIELTEGTSATVVMHPGGENQLTSRQALEVEEGEPGDGDDEETVAEVSIFREGGTLEIECNLGAACRLEVVN
ncbi:MAG: hypothetical protein ACP5JG_17565 [Anaerolineae bacterium]